LHPVLNIHDDLTGIIPDQNQILEESIEQIARIMLNPPYSCINVPLSVTASIGENWGAMKEIGKFWSHKDFQ
jgi:DNA polymerase I-like protein with 3'-5' exonuclease and polymerase domains